jgi:hypothetical protein
MMLSEIICTVPVARNVVVVCPPASRPTRPLVVVVVCPPTTTTTTTTTTLRACGNVILVEARGVWPGARNIRRLYLYRDWCRETPVGVKS